MNRLAGKVALISGGARGQGATETRLFVGEGAAVVFGDVLDDDGKKLEAEIRGSGGQATYVHLDVTREADWRAAVATTVQAYGKLNVLVNNAGILFRAKIEDTSEADWDRIMAVNVKGVFLGTKCALSAMRAAGGGSIINISSTAGLVGSRADGRLHGDQGRRAALHEVDRRAARPRQDSLQLRASRSDRHGHDQGHSRGPGLGATPAPSSHGTRGHTGRGRVRRTLSRLRRIVLRDGQRAGDRRRHHRRVRREEISHNVVDTRGSQSGRAGGAGQGQGDEHSNQRGGLRRRRSPDGLQSHGRRAVGRAYGSQGKAIASGAFARPSGELAERAGSPIIQGIAAAEGGHMIPSQGAVPIIRNGMVDGACGVGGGTSQQDEDCARAGIAKLGPQ